MITERTEIGQITVLPSGLIQVRKDLVIESDGVEIARTFHRHVVNPGADLSKEDPRVANIAKVVHTPQVIASYKEYVASL